MNNNGATSSDSGIGDDLHLRDFIFLLRRNVALILGVTAAIVGATLWYTATTAPVFEANATIHVDRERESMMPGLELMESVLRGGGVETEMALLRARHLAEAVVDSLALQVHMVKPQATARDSVFAEVSASAFTQPDRYTFKRQGDGYVVEDGTGDQVTILPLDEPRVFNGVRVLLRAAPDELPDEIVVNVKERADAIRDLERTLGVGRPFREADLIAVTYQGTDPSVVRAVPNAVSRLFIAQRVAAKKTEAVSMVAFLNEQIETYQLQLRAAEDNLLAFQQGQQIVNLEAEGAEQVSQMVSLQADRDDRQADLSTLNGILSDIERSEAAPGGGGPSPFMRLAGFSTFLQNQAVTELLSELNTANNELGVQLERRERTHPTVIAIERRIAGIEDQLLQLARSYKQNLETSIQSTDTRLAQFGAQLQRIPAKGVQEARLSRQSTSLETVYDMLQARLKEAEIAQAVEPGDVRISDFAVFPREPIRPRKLRSLVLSLLIGLTLGLLLAAGRDYLDETIHTREELSDITGLPVLALIPRIQGMATNGNGSLLRKEKPVQDRLVARDDISNPVSEAYRAFRTNITFLDLETPAKVLVFTSPGPGEGKSTSAANLAITLAQQGSRVVLVDCDLRRGIAHRVFGAAKEPGLTNVLLGTVGLNEAVSPVDVGDTRTLDILSTGTLPPNPSELLGSSRMREVIGALREHYDHVIVDSPPLNVVTDAAVLGTAADGVILIARAGSTEKGALRFARDQLRAVQAPVSGAVLNDVDFKGRDRYYGTGASYAYYYRYYRSDSG